MYGASIPNPTQTSVTRWHSDPFSRGGYSFFAVGNQKNITAALAQPEGRLLFAGEATSSKPATGGGRQLALALHLNTPPPAGVTAPLWHAVLGAYLSGLREAQRVLDMHGAGTDVSLPYSLPPAVEAATN
jgi:hypothetical protein